MDKRLMLPCVIALGLSLPALSADAKPADRGRGSERGRTQKREPAVSRPEPRAPAHSAAPAERRTGKPQEEGRLRDAVAPAKTKTGRGIDKRAAVFAAEFDMEKAEILALRKRVGGWGELRHALEISRRSGRPVSEVLERRESGLGWGRVAASYGFRLGEAYQVEPPAPPAPEAGKVAEPEAEKVAGVEESERLGEPARTRGKERGRGKR